MQAFVLYQMMFVLESLTALITLVRSLIYSKKRKKNTLASTPFHFLFLPYQFDIQMFKTRFEFYFIF